MKNIKPLWTMQKLCKFLSVRENTIRSMVKQGRFPSPIIIGVGEKRRAPRWREDEVLQAVESLRLNEPLKV